VLLQCTTDAMAGLARCRPFDVAEMVLCAAVLIRNNSVGEVVPSHSPLSRIFADFINNGATVRGNVMSGNDSKRPSDAAKAVIMAAYQGDLDTAIARLDAGADVNARDCDGDTALMLAAERGHIELLTLLLVHAADVDARNLNGETALLRAAGNGRTGAVKALLSHDADADAGDIINCRPLMRAAYRGHADVVKELLAHGADATARNAFGNTALSLAARSGHGDVERILREADDSGFVSAVQPKLWAARH
jgi:ankyrin repeat protein